MRHINLDEILKILKRHKEELKRKFKVKEIGIFGSYVRGEETKDSDIDILVEFEEVPDFFDFIKLERYLEEILGFKVDLQTRDSISPYIRKHIEREVKYVLEVI
ncbi:MAG: nucleotidyltransferase family protein [Candidatus Asgardarchaeia archaeon]